MRAIISPYFESQGLVQMLHRGNFVKHYDVEKRGQQIYLGLIDAGCSIQVASSPELAGSKPHEAIVSVHDARYIADTIIPWTELVYSLAGTWETE
jgi:hypothetical protein